MTARRDLPKRLGIPLGISFLHSVSWNWVGIVTETVCSLFLLPLLVSRLGSEGYGFWAVLAAFCGYFQFLDFGLRASIGRYVAHRHGAGDFPGLYEVTSTAATLLCGLGAIACTVSLAISPFLPGLMGLSEDRLFDGTSAAVVTSLNLVVLFGNRLFDAILWGLRRFDLMSMVDIPVSIGRLALCYMFVSGPSALTVLAGSTFVLYALSSLTKAGFCFRQLPSLTLSPMQFRRPVAKELLSFGGYQLAISLSTLAPTTVIPLVIGSSLGAAAVTPFAVAVRVVAIGTQFLTVAVGVLTPVIASLSARGSVSAQRALMLRCGRAAAGLGGGICALIGLLGGPFVLLWVGPGCSASASYIPILASGGFAAITSLVPSSVLVGAARQRAIAIGEILRVASLVPFSVVIAQNGSLIALCWLLSATQWVLYGAVYPVEACQLLGLDKGRYFRATLLNGVLCGAIPVAFTAVLGAAAPDTWVRLGYSICMFTIACAVGTACVLKDETGLLWKRMVNGRGAGTASDGDANPVGSRAEGATSALNSPQI